MRTEIGGGENFVQREVFNAHDAHGARDVAEPGACEFI
jgi:hypothetical protein